MDRPFPAYKGSEPYIFVSYSHKDSLTVYQELDWLKASGFNIWYDEGIEAGTEWREELGKAIEDADLLLFFVTHNSAESENCRKEVSFAVDENIPVISVHLEATVLSAGLKLTLSNRQAILKHDATDQAYAKHLLDGIGKYVAGGRSNMPVVMQRSLGQRLLRSRSLKVIIGFLIVATILMNITNSRVWIVEKLVSVVFSVAAIVSTDEIEVLPGIAVLPFANMSNDPDNEYFSDGISEEILNALVKANRIDVIARTSSFAFKGQNLDIKQIARRLGVTHVLEGSVRKMNNNVRITAQLIDASTGVHLWSETYDRELLNVFAIQDEIAAKVVNQIAERILGGETPAAGVVGSRGTSSSDASNSSNPFEIERAIPLFEQAIAFDQEYVDAWVGLGTTYAMLALSPEHLQQPVDLHPLGVDALRKALDLEPDNARAMGLLGWLLIAQDYNWQEGVAMMRRAVEMNPLDARMQSYFGYVLHHMRQAEGTSMIDKAYRLNPLDFRIILIKCVQLLNSGHVMDAAAMSETLLIRDREGFQPNAMAAVFNAASGRPDIAEGYTAKARAIVGEDYPMIRVLDWMITGTRGNYELADEIATELFERAHDEPVPLLLEIGWDKERIAEVWDLAIENRHINVISKVFGAKPLRMREADWQRIQKLTRTADADLGGDESPGFGRTNEEQVALQLTAVSLSEDELRLYPGKYKGQDRDDFFTIVREGDRLNMVDQSGTIVEMIPQGNHRFDSLQIKLTVAFSVENGEVTQVKMHSGQRSAVFNRSN